MDNLTRLAQNCRETKKLRNMATKEGNARMREEYNGILSDWRYKLDLEIGNDSDKYAKASKILRARG